MKNIIIVVILIIAGYFAYQHFMKQDSTDTSGQEEMAAIPEDQLPEIPDQCSNLARDYDNAIYGVRSGKASQGQLATAYRKFKDCLRESGMSDAEMNGIVQLRQKEVNKKLRMDGYG